MSEKENCRPHDICYETQICKKCGATSREIAQQLFGGTTDIGNLWSCNRSHALATPEQMEIIKNAPNAEMIEVFCELKDTTEEPRCGCTPENTDLNLNHHPRKGSTP